MCMVRGTTMRAVLQSILVLLAAGGTFACSACSKKTPAPEAVAPATAALPPAAAAAAKAVGGDGKLDPNDPAHGTRKLMGLDTPVYVDGTQVAVLRAGEMPSIPYRAAGPLGRRFKVADYLQAIGVDLKAVKSVHFHGAMDRIGSLEGDELRKELERFEFSFLGGMTGAPVQRWSVTGLKNEFVFHEIRRLTVYVKKPSPPLKPGKMCHVGADGDCTTDIPYGDGVLAKGTRVYVDGKMVGFVKRRQVGDNLIVKASDREGETSYSLAKLVAQMGVDLASAKAVELAAGDDIIARADAARGAEGGSELAAFATKTTFTLPPHNHGKVRVRVPAELQAKQEGLADRDGLVSAVLVYKSTTPMAGRDLVAISEETDLSVQVAAIDDARALLNRQGQSDQGTKN